MTDCFKALFSVAILLSMPSFVYAGTATVPPPQRPCTDNLILPCYRDAQGETTTIVQGVYALPLCGPATDNFILPNLSIRSTRPFPGTYSGAVEVPTGSYWQLFAKVKPDGQLDKPGSFGKAHDFSYKVTDAIRDVVPRLLLDNGFILIEPKLNGNRSKSYLLADGGINSGGHSSSKSAAEIANMITAGLNWGPTDLQKIDYGVETVFAKGSFIYVYDDTPDMAGFVDCGALAKNAAVARKPVMKWRVKQ